MKLLDKLEWWLVCNWHEVPGKESTNSWVNIPFGDQEYNPTFGQSVWAMLGQPEIDFIKWLNSGTPKAWQWLDAAKIDGQNYSVYVGSDWKVDIEVKWPRTGFGSRTDWRNDILVDAVSDNGLMYRVVGMPRRNSLQGYIDAMFGGSIQRVFDYNGYNPPVGGPVYVPLFNPADFRRSAGGKEMWIEKKWLLRLHDGVGVIMDIPGFPKEVVIADRGLDWLGRKKTLTLRPGPTMFNDNVDQGFYPGVHVPVLSAFQNSEGVFGLVARGLSYELWLPLYLNSNNTYYTDWRP